MSNDPKRAALASLGEMSSFGGIVCNRLKL
jgi:hypothetical protein